MILTFSVFMALLLCGCTSYCYEDTVSDMEIMYGSYFMFFLKYNPDGGGCPIINGMATLKNRYSDSRKYGKQKIKCLGGYFGKGVPSPFFIDCSPISA
ncbi:MAG: hypothetical protein ACLR56_07090 [Oscillospiraceae bacterium]